MAASGAVLLVPAAAWHALEEQVAQLKAQQSETRQYIKHSLKVEYARRERACVRIQAAARGRLSRRMPA
eukprot:6248255-Prymnesium_polylepis.1